MNCSETEKLYSAYLEDELYGSRLEKFERHLADCPRCSAEMQKLTESLAVLRELPSPEPEVTFSDDVISKMRGNSIPIIQLWNRVPLWIREKGMVAAAALLAAFILGLGVARLGPDSGSVDEKMRAAGMQKLDGEWISSATLRRARDGMVLIDGKWLAGDAAVTQLMVDRGFTTDKTGRWLPEESRDKVKKGLIYYRGKWHSPSGVAELVMEGNKLQKQNGGWVTAGQKAQLDRQQQSARVGEVFADGVWIKAEEYAKKVMKNKGLLARADGTWEHRTTLEKEKQGFVRVAGEWRESAEYETEVLGSKGLVKLENGEWQSRDRVERERQGLVLFNNSWFDPDDFVAEILKERGYVLNSKERWCYKGKRPRSDEEAVDWQDMQEDKKMLASLSKRQDRLLLSGLRNMPVRGTFHKSVKVVKSAHKGGISEWRVKIPKAVAGQALGTPAFADGRVFVGGGLSSKRVYAFAADSGQLSWGATLSDNGPSNPAVGDGNVYYNTESCTLYSLKMNNGRKSWAKFISAHVDAMPRFADSKVITSFKSRSGYALAAFSSDKGKEQWHALLPGDTFTAAEFSNNRVFVTTTAGTVHCYELKNGALIWAKDVHALTSPTVIDKERIMIRRAMVRHDPKKTGYTGGGGSYAEVCSILDARTGAYVERLVGRVRPLVVSSLKDLFADRPDGKVKAAAVDRGLAVSARPGVTANYGGVLVATRGDVLEAVDSISLEQLWKVELREKQKMKARRDSSRLTHSDPCIAGDKVFVGTLGGRLLCVDAKNGKLVWEIDTKSPVGNFSNGTFTMLQVQPVVANGRIFITTLNGELICYDTGNRELNGPHSWGGGEILR